MQRATRKTLPEQVKARVEAPKKKKEEFTGNTETMISTGSTLLDLAISGGRIRGGGLPGGIVVEIFGPHSTGKTVLLCEIAGGIQRQEGRILFNDPEARLNKQFAKIFGLDIEGIEYYTPNTVTEVFSKIRSWDPNNEGKINGVITDSLAALSTDLEMDDEEGDKMGMRRAKEFSEGFRKTARLIKDRNLLMVCSNQIRESTAQGGFAKYVAPGGKAIGYYSSLRLQTSLALRGSKLTKEVTFRGKQHKQVYGIQIEVNVVKSSIWNPSRTAPVTIDFGYGVDDVRENLKFLKKWTGATTYQLGKEKLSPSLADAIIKIESRDLVTDLREEVIDLWEEIEEKFEVERRPKVR